MSNTKHTPGRLKPKRDTARLTIDIWKNRGAFTNDDQELAELFEPHLEHIASMVARGCWAGEICDENFSGWWSVERDPAIAKAEGREP